MCLFFKHIKMKTADILRTKKKKILENWLDKVRKEMPLVNKYDKTAIQNSVPDLIDSIIDILETKNSDVIKNHSEHHGWQRTKHPAYSMKHIIKEYNLLRAEIFIILDENSEVTSTNDR